MFSRPIHDVGWADIVALIDQSVVENESVEFKEAIPSKDGTSKSIDITDHGRNKLTEEVVAFANAHGGTLVIGIGESETKPPKAETIVPIANVGSVAEKLSHIFRDCIEPSLKRLIVKPVLQNDTDGVIVIQIPMSQDAPHRCTTTKECLVRRADRAEKMSMLEIQDLTILRERRFSDHQAFFSKCADDFRERNYNFFRADAEAGFAIRVTAMPMDKVLVRRVFDDINFHPARSEHKAKFQNGGSVLTVFVPSNTKITKAILRGVEVQYLKTEKDSYVGKVTDEGVIDFEYRELCVQDRLQYFKFMPLWLIGVVSDAISTVINFREKSLQNNIEYAVQIEIFSLSNNTEIPIAEYSDRINQNDTCFLPKGNCIFPIYVLGSGQKATELISIFERDFWNFTGVNRRNTIVVDI